MSLPERYRRFLLDFPPNLFRPEAESAEWDWGPPDHMVFHTARTMIEYNRAIRESAPCVRGADGSLIPWPKEYFTIGTIDGGMAWAIRLDDTGDDVYMLSFFGVKLSRIGRTLREHANWMAASINRVQQALSERNQASQ